MNRSWVVPVVVVALVLAGLLALRLTRGDAGEGEEEVATTASEDGGEKKGKKRKNKHKPEGEEASGEAGEERRAAKSAGPRPKLERGPINVVLLMLDTTRADRLEVYDPELPDGLSAELDARARSGVRFLNAIATTPWTRPSIGAMLSGRPGRELGIYKEKAHGLRDDVTTLAEYLQQGGFRTLGLTANPNINAAFNFHQGFDEYVSSNVVWEWMTAQDDQEKDSQTAGLVPARELYKRALELARAPHKGPTYLQINVMDVHEWSLPETVRPEFKELYTDRKDAPYLQAVRQTSIDTEAFFEDLLALPGWERTLVIITADHGEGLKDHPDVKGSGYHGPLLYKSTLHVPLILFSTAGDLPAGATPDTLVTLEDLVPTVLDYVGLSPAPEVKGTSILPLIFDVQGPILERPERAFVETRYRKYKKIGVVTPDWLYVESKKEHEGVNPEELQPWNGPQNGAKTDVKAQNPKVVEKLSGALDRYLKQLPSAPPWTGGEQTPEEIEQLKAMGYLQ